MPDEHRWPIPFRGIADGVAQQKRAFLAAPPLIRAIAIVGLAALSGYLATTFVAGGDAAHGRVEAGRYFMRHDPSAPEHEVGAALFLANMWLFRTVMAMWVVGVTMSILRAASRWLRARPTENERN